MSSTDTPPVRPDRLSVYRLMEDATLERAILQLERELDRLEDGYWPHAKSQRAHVLEQLDHARAELERRDTP